MIPLRCNVSDCFEMPLLEYTINRNKVYRCGNHSIKCHTNNCPKNPTMSFKHNNNTIFYCSLHGKTNQINVCKNINCDSIATYGPSNSNIPLLCVKHKTSSMEVVITQCGYFGCQNKPNYNYLTLFKEAKEPKGIYCDKHRNSNMISIDDFNRGYVIKPIEKDDSDTLEVSKQDIIKYETKIINKIDNLNINNTFHIIYDMRNDNDIKIRSMLNEYVII